MSIKTQSERQEIIDDFLQWLEQNRGSLPVNAATWNFQFVERAEIPANRLINLGKYNALKGQTSPFYKPYSKIYKI